MHLGFFFNYILAKIELRPFKYLNMILKKFILIKLYFLVLDAKILINHVDFFFFFREPIDTKNLTNFSHLLICQFDSDK